MQIWVDADSVPLIAKDLIIKTAERTQTMAIFVANQPIKLRKSPLLVMTVVPSGFDKADDISLSRFSRVIWRLPVTSLWPMIFWTKVAWY